MPPSDVFKKLAAYSLLALSLTGCARRAIFTHNKTDLENRGTLPTLITPVRDTLSPAIVVPETLAGFSTAKKSTCAHSHNDYRHKNKSLVWALDNNFYSVEGDVYRQEGVLCLGHTSPNPNRTLEAIYIDPLVKRVQENNGHVYKDSKKSFILLIDIKSNGDEAYEALVPILEKHKGIFTTYDKFGVHEGPITVLLSGNHPTKAAMKQPIRCAGLDGRFNVKEVQKEYKASNIINSDENTPLISANWKHIFGWNGKGKMPAKEQELLHQIVEVAHAKGQQVRFWNSPDKKAETREAVWKELYDADVDLINTDHIPELNVWLLKQEQLRQEQIKLATTAHYYTGLSKPQIY